MCICCANPLQEIGTILVYQTINAADRKYMLISSNQAATKPKSSPQPPPYLSWKINQEYD